MPGFLPNALANICAAAMAVLVLPAAVFADEDPEARLEALRQRIERVQAGIESDSGRRDEAVARLREAEKKSARASSDLRATRRALGESRERQGQLRSEADAARGRLDAGRQALAEHVRAAHAMGSTDRLKLMLNQQDPARLGRILVYYRYLSRMKAEQINRILEDLERLRSVEKRMAANAARLETLVSRQAREKDSLETARQQRAKIVAAIDAGIRDRRGEAVRLEAEAKTLEALIAELRRALDDIPGTDREPFRSRKGQLSWPIAGKLISDYGQPRADGSLRWNGVLVGTVRGRNVRAIYYGRVAYADWLPGMGLLIVIEHGDGYMSLYGHNETLNKQVGDWVEPGEVIAGAGDSGGRERAALYFEIRRGADPENPHRWFAGRLPAG
jgi:septal ring factor EnvC (AmiA/AmiB activator)